MSEVIICHLRCSFQNKLFNVWHLKCHEGGRVSLSPLLSGNQGVSIEGEKSSVHTHTLPRLVSGVEKETIKNCLHSSTPGRYRPLLTTRTLPEPLDSCSTPGTPNSPVSQSYYLKAHEGNDKPSHLQQKESQFTGVMGFSLTTLNLYSVEK